jgi:hypothetical protein
MKEDLIMKSNHISITLALITCIRVILAGEDPFTAVTTCFRMRRLTNSLFDLGFAPEDIFNSLSTIREDPSL